MKSLRAKSVGSAGPQSVQQQIEKAFDVPRGAQAETVFQIFSRDERGRIQYLDSLSYGDLSPETIRDVIKETFGGGRFHVLPVAPGKKSGEAFELTIQGASKIKKPAEKATTTTRGSKTKESDELEEIRKELESLRGEQKEEALKGWFRGEMESQMQSLEAKLNAERSGKSNVLDQLVANLPVVVPVVLDGLRSLSSRDPAPDMISQVRGVLGLVNELTPATPPVTTAQPGGFFAGSGTFSQFAEALAKGAASAFIGRQAEPALPGAAPQPAGAEAPGASAGFGGVPEAGSAEAAGQAAAPTPEFGYPAAGPNPLANITLQSFGIQPIKRLLVMLSQSAPVENVAEYFHHLLHFGLVFCPIQEIRGYIQAFLANPAEVYDRFAPRIPQIGSPKYSEDLKEAIVQTIESYTYQQAGEEEDDGLYEDEQTVDESEDTPEAQDAPEAPVEEQDSNVDESVVTAEEPTE